MCAIRRVITLLLLPCFAVANPPSADEIRSRVADHQSQAIELFREFLRLPNDANYPDDIENLVTWLEGELSRRGFETDRIATDGSPLLFAERPHAPGAKTVLVYLQADGQPVDPRAWDQEDPFTPVLKARKNDGSFERIDWQLIDSQMDEDWRIFARSAADSKGPMSQFMSAVELLDRAGFEFPYNLKVIIDTEEEMGSPHLPEAVLQHRQRLAADLLLIFDGPPHASNEPTLGFGARGILTVTLVSYGPLVPQHSGHYGNFVPNPAFHLARILASMESADGRVAIPGFYDGIEIDEETRAVLDAVPDDESAILASMGLIQSDEVAPTLQESLQYPSINIRGLSSGWTGAEARTIIPATATAELDIRLVKESNHERLLDLMREHIRNLGYHIVDRAPTMNERTEFPRIVSFAHQFNYNAYRSDMNAAAGRMARAGMRHLYGHEPILIRTSGGSVPIAPFVETLGVPAAKVPTVNIDNNQHSPNENIRLGNFIEGIAIVMAVLSQTPD